MKKLLSILLCIVFICFAFVGCSKKEIGDIPDNYNYNNATGDSIETLNLYIMVGAGTSADATTTVPQNINTYLLEKYHVQLNIEYYTYDPEKPDATYEQFVYDAMNTTDETARPDIILVAGENMFDTIFSNNDLADLTALYSSRDFRSINTILDKHLLAASAIYKEDGTPSYYTVPNTHRIGSYQYIVINKEMARDTLHFSEPEIKAMTTAESVQPLIDKIGEYYDHMQITDCTKEEYVAKFVSVNIQGNYEDKVLYEHVFDYNTHSVSVKNVVNVIDKNYLNSTFKYAAIDLKVADMLGYTVDQLKALTSEDDINNLINALGAYYELNVNDANLTKEVFVAQLVQVVESDYAERYMLLYGVDTEAVTANYVNISATPVATKAEAFQSAFAIVKHLEHKDYEAQMLIDPDLKIPELTQAIYDEHYALCMKIIYALNTDVQLMNMLQYGSSGLNYKFVKNEKNENTSYITLNTGVSITYNMNLTTTGNLYIGYFCESIGWDEVIYNNILIQNSDAVVPEVVLPDTGDTDEGGADAGDTDDAGEVIPE